MLKASLPSTIQIQQYIDPAAGIIEADATEIHQIIMNLGANAYHAMSETGGRLEVKVENADLNTETAGRLEIAAGNYLALSVSDTGCGMSPEVMERIFEPYFTTKEKGKGTGLGLSMVNAIVQNYDGAIECSSSPGAGTTFSIYLPPAVAVADFVQSGSQQQLSDISRGHEVVLIVDDDERIRDLLKKFLMRNGFLVTAARDAEHARRVLSGLDFDMIIMDVMMPGEDGIRGRP